MKESISTNFICLDSGAHLNHIRLDITKGKMNDQVCTMTWERGKGFKKKFKGTPDEAFKFIDDIFLVLENYA